MTPEEEISAYMDRLLSSIHIDESLLDKEEEYEESMLIDYIENVDYWVEIDDEPEENP